MLFKFYLLAERRTGKAISSTIYNSTFNKIIKTLMEAITYSMIASTIEGKTSGPPLYLEQCKRKKISIKKESKHSVTETSH